MRQIHFQLRANVTTLLIHRAPQDHTTNSRIADRVCRFRCDVHELLEELYGISN